MSHDAVVIGSGPNGLVAANLLADRGWSVLVCEAAAQPGGAVRSAEIAEPGFTADLYSAFYPLGAASPILRALDLERHGLEWARSPAAVAHPHSDGRCAVLWNDIDRTAESVERFATGDGERWRELQSEWERWGAHFIEALMSPFPPVKAGTKLLAALRRDALRFLRFSLLPARRMTEERFRGEGAGWLIAGNALHADLTPDSAGGGFFGWVLCGLGQHGGFPFPRGGAGRLSGALVSRLRSLGGELECNARVERIEVTGGRASAVHLAGGERRAATRAVLADVTAPALYGHLLAPEHVPPRLREDLRRFQFDNGTVKLDWALDGPIPWQAQDARSACTVHVADGMDALTAATSELVRGLVPEKPFVVLGQYSMADPTRAPEGKEAAWGYTHVPQGAEVDREAFADRMEDQIEACAPGFRGLIRSRHVAATTDLQEDNPNLVHGAINSGTAQLHQQVIFRPTPGLARPETPVRGLFLASASAHPGGGVHGGPGANAARAAVWARRRHGVFALPRTG